MDLEKLKKIPLFKNADFEDPRTKKRIALLFAAAAAIMSVLILNIATSSKDSASIATKQDDTTFLELPEGNDNDILENEDMVVVYERMTPGNKDLFLESRPINDDNPLGFLEEEQNGIFNGSNTNNASTKEAREAAAMAAFGMADNKDASNDATPPSGTVVDAIDNAANLPANIRDAIADGSSSRVTPASAGQKKSREEIEAQEEQENRAAGRSSKKTPSSGSGRGRTLADAERQKRDGTYTQTNQEAPQDEAPRAVRRSGGISSLEGDWGTVEGISSLDNESQYVTQDDDHPYRVMFTRDQKIKSGDRITVRLLEDMAVDGVLIPKNTHLSATCQIGERLQIVVTNIEINGRIYALNYTAYDNDGSQGLYCPISGATQTSDKTKNSAVQSASNILSSAASIAGSAMGSSALGSIVGNMSNIGASAITSRNGSVTAQVNSGYTFYLLKM